VGIKPGDFRGGEGSLAGGGDGSMVFCFGVVECRVRRDNMVGGGQLFVRVRRVRPGRMSGLLQETEEEGAPR
jgi:hypothetical protein